MDWQVMKIHSIAVPKAALFTYGVKYLLILMTAETFRVIRKHSECEYDNYWQAEV